MPMSQTDHKAERWITKHKQWRDEFIELRQIVLDAGLNETIKWMHPCYMLDDKNVIILQDFKNYCAMMFIKGALLDDPAGMLVKLTENTQAARQLRFTNVDEITEMAHIIKAYVNQAIEVEKAGLEVEFKDTSEFNMPEEFQTALDENPALKSAFEALTPGRQRGYLLYFSGAKQSKTRTSRVEKYTQHILDGKGLND
ncbi:MAG: YdeI/OmpD-associated family protein [Anaerolineae bacterium]|nr:YdeI/OmpD-associated family protein [Anaerolineae bacterium]